MVLNEMGMFEQGAVKMCWDNQGSLSWAEAEVRERRAKHVDLKYHYIQDCVASKVVMLQHVSSAENNLF